jgi:hypothetical protein
MFKPYLVAFAGLYLGLGTGTLVLDEHCREQWLHKSREAFALGVGVALVLWAIRPSFHPFVVSPSPEFKPLRHLLAEEEAKAVIASLLLVVLVVPWDAIVECCDAGVTCGAILGLLLTVPVAVSNVAGKE